MNTFPVSPMIVERLGWVLVHTVWQFAAVALLAGVIVQAMRNRSANARCSLLVAGLAFSAVVPAITWMLLPDVPNATASQTPVAEHVPQVASAPLGLSDPAIAAPVSVSGYPLRSPLPDARKPVGASKPLPEEPLIVPTVGPLAPRWSERAAELLRPWLAWIVAGWCIGVALCSLRPLLGWHTLRRLRRVGVSPVSDDVLATLGRVSKRLGLRRAVRVLQSTLARVPVVVGYFRPVILLPVSLVTSIPAAQLEAILAHELAHVRRHDFLVNLLQTLVETLFFYHPAVWWLSSRLRGERENCCDDLVVATMGNRVAYGRALLAIEELRGYGSVLAVGATDGPLLARVRRIVGLPSETASNSPWSALVLVVCGIVLAAVMSLLSWNSRVKADLKAQIDEAIRQADEPANAALANHHISLADAVRDFNAENQRLGLGLDQPLLTEEEVIAAIKRSDWKRDVPHASERAIAAFKAVAETRRLPKEAYLQAWTSEDPSPLTVIHKWQVQLYMPTPDGGFDGFTIRYTKLREEKIDPKSVAWGRPDAEGLSLGLFLLPKKDQYQIGERVQLRLLVRNEGQKTIEEMTFWNITWPETKDFTVTDQNGAKVQVRNSQMEEWSGPGWIAGATGGSLDPGDVHAFRIPFELAIGGDGSNKRVGRVVDARPGQTLQLRLRAHNGSNRVPAKNEPPPQTGSVTFKVATLVDAGVQALPPLLEFRFAAQPADSKFELRVPVDYEKRDYSGNSAIGRMVAKDKGFVWVPVNVSKDRVSALPVERLRGGQVREALLADTPEHALPANGKWSIEDCRVVPDPNNSERFFIWLKLNEAGGVALRALTKAHLNQPLAILVNNEIVSAPIVREEFGQNIAITGMFTRERADALLAVIRASLRVQIDQEPGAANPDTGTFRGVVTLVGERPKLPPHRLIETKLPVRVTTGQTTELALKYRYDVENSRFAKPDDAAPPAAPSPTDNAFLQPSARLVADTKAPPETPLNPLVPQTNIASDPFAGTAPGTESGYPVIQLFETEVEPDGWIPCEFGLQYRVRAETTSLVAGELPLIFVDLRNRGTFKDMGLEMFQARHDVVVDGNRFVRADKAWAGVTPLEPAGQPLTLAFALSDDWKREGEAKTPLLFPQGKHSIALSVVIAPVYLSKSESPPEPAARRPIRRLLVCRPIEIEVRSGAWTGPPGSLGLVNIRREVIAIPDFHSPKVPANLQRLVAEHQPAAGDYLVTLIKSDDASLQQAAAVVFADAWDSMNREQIESYLLATMTHFAGLRSRYPQAVDALIGVGTRNRPGYLGMPVDRKYSAETITTLHLDGQQVGEPVTYPAWGSLTHWIKTKDLPLGRHNFRLATKFTFTRGSETYRGEFESPEFAFEMVPADTPDHLIAPPDEQLDPLVREALQVAETEYELDHPPGSLQFDPSQPDVPDSEKWRPQIRYGENKLGVASLHVPVWKLAKRLPVDLCFSVEFRIENTDTVIRCNDLVSLADREGRGYFGTFDFAHVADLLKHADKDGLVSGQLVLKASRSAALTNEKVNRYYGGEITTRPLRFQVVRVSSTGPQAETADDTINPNGEIVGQLVDEMGQPVAGMTVVAGAIINDSDKRGGAKTVTDAAGRYRLKMPSPGIYNVYVRHLETEPPEVARMTAIADNGVLVEAGKVATSRMVWMAGTRVVGTLVDERGQPVPDTTVYCYSMAKPQTTAEVVTVKSDEQGRFEFWLPPGRAHLYASKRPAKLQADAMIVVPRRADRPSESPPLKLVLAASKPKPLGDPTWTQYTTSGTQVVRQDDASGVSGTVVDVDGKPIAGAKVFRYDGPFVDANEQGEFQVTAPRGTAFILYAFQPGYDAWWGTPASGDVLKIVLERKRLPVIGAGASDSSTDRPPTADEASAKRVSLPANEMPLKQALAALARQAGVALQLDVDALKAVELDLDAPVTASLTDETLEEALGRLIDWRGHLGAFGEFRAGRLVVTTITARQQRVAAQLPEWLQPLYTHGLFAAVDDDGQVESITTSSIVTDELLEKLTTLSKLRELQIEVTKTLTPAGLRQLGKMQNLETLSLYEVNSDGRGLGDEALQAIAELKSLQELRVSDCGLTDAGARHLEGLPQLTRLELDEGRLTDAALASIGKLRHLKHLSLSNYVGTVHYGRMHFTTAGLRSLSGLPELEELHLVGQEVTADLLTSWPKLTELSLGGTTVDDACAERIAACRNLKSLSLVYTAVSDEGLKQIATLPALRRLNLDSREITDASMEYLKAVKTLEMLTLRTTQLTDESLRHIAEMKSLTRLDLHGSGQPGFSPGDNFSINALRQLKALPKLRSLWLTNFQSPGGYLALADLTQLRELSLLMADVRSDDLDALKEALPHTTIHSATGGGTRLPKAKQDQSPAPNQPADNGAAVPTANGDPLVRQHRSPMVRYGVQPRTL